MFGKCRKVRNGEEKKYIRKKCKECNSTYRQKYHVPLRRKVKAIVMNEYGNGKCECCGEKNIEFLTIDHIGGKKTRIELGHVKGKGGERNAVKGYGLYSKLVNDGFPYKDKLRVLCWNCNCSIGMYGYCPHVKGGIKCQGVKA